MDRNQGIYLNGTRVSANADSTTIHLVEEVLRIAGGVVEIKVWSKGRVIREARFVEGLEE